MTFVEAAVAVLRQHGRPLHYKKLVEMALRQQLLTHAGRTPEETMQTQLALAIKRAPDRSPFVDAGNGVYGLKSYPSREEVAAEKAAAKVAEKAAEKAAEKPAPVEKGKRGGKAREAAEPAAGKRRRGRGGKAAPAAAAEAADAAAPAPRDEGAGQRKGRRRRRRGEAEAEPQQPTPAQETAAEVPAAEGEGAVETAPPVAAVESAPTPAPDGTPAELAPAEAPAPDAAASAKEVVGAVGSQVPGAPPLVMIRRGAGPTPPAGEAAPAAAEAPGPAEPEPPRPPAPRPPAPDFRGGRPHDRERERREPPPGERREPPPGERRPDRPSDMSPADAAFEILRAQGDGRPLHARQILDMASKRRLTRIDTPEPWRALRAAVIADGRDRLASGLRPRFRVHGGGLYSMSTRHLDAELVAAERQVAERCDDLRRATRTSVARLIAKLGPASFEQVVWLLLDRLGHREIAQLKRADRRIYLACVRTPMRLCAALHVGNVDDGKQAVLDLRAEIQRIGARAGMLFASGSIPESAVNEAREPGPPLSLYDASQVAELCATRSLGVVRGNVPVDYLDIEFFSDLLEG
jgi:hypothetical protein